MVNVEIQIKKIAVLCNTEWFSSRSKLPINLAFFKKKIMYIENKIFSIQISNKLCKKKKFVQI